MTPDDPHTPARFPRFVYSDGDEPDPRFSLANERTFLAWIRTALALVAVGIAIDAFAPHLHPTLRFIAALVFIGLAIAATVNAWWSWARTERALRRGRALPGPTVGVYITAGVVVAVLLLVAALLL